MNFGLTFEKLLLIGVIAALIIGPERLPRAAEAFAGFVRRAGQFARDAKGKMREEMGPELDDVDWRKLDPRQYDPRRIIRDALFEDAPGTPAAAAGAAAVAVSGSALDGDAASASSGHTPRVRPEFTKDSPPPFDVEAT